jgi:hypothetical protein
MATYDLAFHTRLDGVVVLQTFVETGIQVGDVVTIAGAGHDINGAHTVLSTQDNEYIGESSEGDFEFDNDVIRLFSFFFETLAMMLSVLLRQVLSHSHRLCRGYRLPM